MLRPSEDDTQPDKAASARQTQLGCAHGRQPRVRPSCWTPGTDAARPPSRRAGGATCGSVQP